VQFVDALPKSGAGKVMWRILQEKETPVLKGKTHV
jgi:fatty-acyl-CoA synthase